MAAIPQSFLDHLKQRGYHPRSDKHSNAICEAMVADLLGACPAIRDRAALGQLVYDLNFTLFSGTADWNVDLVLGTPETGSSPPEGLSRIRCSEPSTVQIAIEVKSVMTEHRKAMRNRKRDLEAHHEHVHRYSQQAIAGGVLIVNAASTFRSPLRAAPTTHRDPDSLAQFCLDQFRAIRGRSTQSEQGLDARAYLLLRFDNAVATVGRGRRESASTANRRPRPL